MNIDLESMRKLWNFSSRETVLEELIIIEAAIINAVIKGIGHLDIGIYYTSNISALRFRGFKVTDTGSCFEGKLIFTIFGWAKKLDEAL
jgi:hypothetical protein